MSRIGQHIHSENQAKFKLVGAIASTMLQTKTRLKVSMEADVQFLCKCLGQFMTEQGTRDLLGLFKEQPPT